MVWADFIGLMKNEPGPAPGQCWDAFRLPVVGSVVTAWNFQVMLPIPSSARERGGVDATGPFQRQSHRAAGRAFPGVGQPGCREQFGRWARDGGRPRRAAPSSPRTTGAPDGLKCSARRSRPFWTSLSHYFYILRIRGRTAGCERTSGKGPDPLPPERRDQEQNPKALAVTSEPTAVGPKQAGVGRVRRPDQFH